MNKEEMSSVSNLPDNSEQESVTLKGIKQKVLESIVEKLLKEPSNSFKKIKLRNFFFNSNDQELHHVVNLLSNQSYADFLNKDKKFLNRWKALRDFIPMTVVVSLFLWLFGLYSTYQSELRANRTNHDRNDQRIVESYFNNIKDIQIGEDYKQAEDKENDFIHNLTLITLRELSSGSNRKAAIALLLNKLEIPVRFNQPDINGQLKNDLFYKGADLKFIDFTGYEFKQADFSKADLRGAIFKNARLERAKFSKSELTCSDQRIDSEFGWIPYTSREHQRERCTKYIGAKLLESDFRDADLTGADLTDANLTGSDLTDANLTGANLNSAILATSKFNDLYNERITNLSGSILIKANLLHIEYDQKTNWDSAIYTDSTNPKDYQTVFPEGFPSKIQSMMLRIGEGADLQNANLKGLDLSSLNLKGADLTGADLTDANLAGADLTDALLSQAIVKNAKIDENTRMNSDIKKELLARGLIAQKDNS